MKGLSMYKGRPEHMSYDDYMKQELDSGRFHVNRGTDARNQPIHSPVGYMKATKANAHRRWKEANNV